MLASHCGAQCTDIGTLGLCKHIPMHHILFSLFPFTHCSILGMPLLYLFVHSTDIVKTQLKNAKAILVTYQKFSKA